MCVYMYYICIHVCIYINDTYILRLQTLFNIRHSSGSVVSHVGLAWSLLWGVSPMGVLLQSRRSVSFLIFLAVVYIYYSCFHMYCSSICIALWLGCQTICSNIPSMHVQQLPAFKISMGWVRGDANIALACLLLHSFLSYISCHIYLSTITSENELYHVG